MKTLIAVIEKVYIVMYFAVAVIAGIILLPLSFFFSKPHYEESGYDI